MKQLTPLIALLSGLIFGCGLILSGMTNPANVRAFLDISRDWNPALALVMGSAIVVAAPVFAWVRKRGQTLPGQVVDLNNRRQLDRRLLIGSAIFGAGWGMLGVCPGPGLVVAASGDAGGLLFVGAMSVGMVLCHWLSRRR